MKRQKPSSGTKTFLSVIKPDRSWDDLVIPKTESIKLHDIVSRIKQKNSIRVGSKVKQGVTVLFTGQSGTGKTIAAEIIASALGLDIYRIDLSQIVNKYIGETEKNLKKIFDAAEDSGAILFFDEADALFGKRSGVTDSHDRYSNQEVSYLLQRLEEFSGLAILSTNMKNDIDDDFQQEFQTVIDFKLFS
jgi:SpoVK/Ycf46/Vps4 family AAA+-type ATPase